MNRILLVDDEDRMVQLLKLYLEPHGYLCDADDLAINQIKLGTV